MKKHFKTDRSQSIEADEVKTLSEFIYKRLKTDILWGKLRPGDSLKSDHLRTKYGIGISPLREALSRLTSERLVTSTGQRGFRVAELTKEDVLDTMETRIIIEKNALIDSMRNGDIDWEKDVVSSFYALSRLQIPTDEGEQAEFFSKYHRDFHMALLSGSGSSWQKQFSALLFDQAERHRVVIFQIDGRSPVRRNAMKEHKDIMEAVLARNERVASKLIEQHYRDTATSLVRHLNAVSRRTLLK